MPVLNEADNLPRLFQSLRAIEQEYSDEFSTQIVLVDDGSTDGSSQFAADQADGLNIIVLRHPENLGPGAAFGTAFAYLADCLQEQDWVLTIEGDNTSRLDLIRKMLYRTREGYEVILASPYMYGGGITNTSPLRIFLSSIANTFVKEFLRIHGILTVSSFFRLFRASVIQRLQTHYGLHILEQSGFECMVEMLIKMINLRITISEVPMLLDTNLRVGKSKMGISRTIRGYFACWMKMRQWRTSIDIDQALSKPPIPAVTRVDTLEPRINR